ncbi:MAG: hypothetical protein RL226_1987 [Bacteroidota bacterium]
MNTTWIQLSGSIFAFLLLTLVSCTKSVDSIAPSVTISAIALDSIVPHTAGMPFSFDVSFSDEGELNQGRVKVIPVKGNTLDSISYGGWNDALVLDLSGQTASRSVTLEPIEAAIGRYQIQVDAIDDKGNASATRRFYLNLQDWNLPVISLSSINDDASQPVALSGETNLLLEGTVESMSPIASLEAEMGGVVLDAIAPNAYLIDLSTWTVILPQGLSGSDTLRISASNVNGVATRSYVVNFD